MSQAVQNMMNHKDIYKYQDMIDLPHPVSRTHPPMPVLDRAAQFAPFAALSGHHEAVRETARLTEERAELDEDRRAELDRELHSLREGDGMGSAVSFTYFVPDPKKAGGCYTTVTGNIKRIKEYERSVLLEDGTEIRMEEIISIEREDNILGGE